MNHNEDLESYRRVSGWFHRATLLAASLLLAVAWPCGSYAASSHPIQVYVNLTYSGNPWMTEALNGIKAEAATPPYNSMVELHTIISGTSIQQEISDIQGMVARGAKIIVSYPLSPTALNRAIEGACKHGVVFITMDSPVTAPCAINVTGAGNRVGANDAQWVVNQLHGHGTIAINHGVAGTPITQLYTEEINNVLKRYPAIKVVAQYFGHWDDATSQLRTSQVMAAHPDIDAIITTDGNYGTLKAVMAHRPNRLIVLTGGGENGVLQLMADKQLQQKGLNGLVSQTGPDAGPYAFKIAMEVVAGKLHLGGRNVALPGPWVDKGNIKMCAGDKLVDNCNYFPSSVAPPTFMTTALNSTLLPELDVKAVMTGRAVPGMTIKPLPPVRYAPDIPGIDCSACTASAESMEPDRVKPIAVPR